MGFWSDEEEFAGLKAVEVLKGNRVHIEGEEPRSLANEEAIQTIMLNNPGDMAAYRSQYMVGFRRMYRESYSTNRLNGYGFSPTTGTIRALDKKAFMSWIATQTSPVADTYLSLVVGKPSADLTARFKLQQDYGDSWSNANNTLYQEEIEGTLDDWVFVDKPTWMINTLNIKLRGVANQFNIVIIYYSDIEKDSKMSTLVYESDAYGKEWWVHSVLASSVPGHLYTSRPIEASPVIALKENNVLNPKERACINVMDELGIDGEGMWKEMKTTCPPPEEHWRDKEVEEDDGTCEESERIPSTIDNAYIMTAISPDSTDPVLHKAMYEWFNTFAGTVDGAYSIEMSKLSMSYDFEITTRKVYGVIGHKNKYTKELMAPGFDDEDDGTIHYGFENFSSTLMLRWQNENDSYQEIRVTNFSQTWQITRNGDNWLFYSIFDFEKYGDGESNELEARLLIPLDMYNNIDYDTWVAIHETGMILLAYSHETIKLKWWQTGIFKILILIVITVVTWGSGTPLAQAIFETLINAAIAMAIAAAANVLASMTDSEILQTIIYIVAAIATVYATGGNFNDLSGFDGFLKMADVAVKAYNKAENTQTAAAMIASEEEIKELEEENEDLQEMLKDMEGVNGSLYIKDYNMDIATTTANGVVSPEAYFYQKQGGNLFNYDSLFDVSAVYDMKKNVKT